MQQRKLQVATQATPAEDAAFLLDAFGLADFEVNLATGALRSSPRLNALYGRPAEHALTLEECRARCHPDDRGALEAVVAESHGSGERRFEREFRILEPEGNVRWLLSRGEVLPDAAGQPAVLRGAATEVTESKRREAHLAFLTEIADDFARLTTANAIMERVGAKIGAYLQVSSCVFIDVDEARGELTAISTWNRTDVPSLQRTFRTTDYLTEEFGRASRAGEMVVVRDTQADPRTDGPAYLALNVLAFVTVPFHRNGLWTHYLGVTDSRPRDWRDDELVLIEELSNRIFPRLERAHAEAALRESEARYRTLLDSIDQAFCLFEMIYDPAGTPVDYRFLKVNHTFERHTGLQDAVGKTARELVPNLESHWLETYGRVAATGELLRFEQGSAAMGRWFEVEGVRVGEPDAHQVALIFTDITARREAEADRRFLSEVSEQIRLSEDADLLLDDMAQLLGRHLQVARCFFAAIDDQDDRWSVRHEHRQPEELPTLIGAHRLSAFPQPVLAALSAGRVVNIDDTALDARTAPSYALVYQPLDLRAFVTVPLRRNGQWVADLAVIGATPHLWSVREISLVETVAERSWNAVEKLRLAAAQRASAARLEQLYAQEQAARAQAEEASRLKDEFLATVSHELRTPLTAFLGYAQLLQRRKRDEAYVARAIDKMVRSAQAQAELIEDLLDVSRVVSGKLQIEPTLVALADVVHAALDTVRPSLEAKGLQLQAELGPTACVVLGDAGRLQQVVWNLLSNAAKFTGPGGQVSVRLTSAEGGAELAVSDTGLGIGPDFLPYVFEHFRQADSTSRRAFGGLGLGLAIVRHLVELHGGTVEATSAGVGQGATFTVRLPLATATDLAEQAHSPADPAAEPDAGARPLGGLRVVIVDDQPAILELLAEILTSEGASVRTCASAPEALALVQAWRPDVLVSDIAMPDEDGYWLIKQVRNLAPEAGGATPAVALTAYVRIEDRLRVVAAGFQQYVPKPVDAAELRNVIARLALTGQDG